jgi:hypothetical protein
MSISPHLRRGGESLSHQAKRGVAPVEKPVKREKSTRRLARRTTLAPTSSRLKATPLGHCTEEQKARVASLACIVCGEHLGHCHPAHVIDRASVNAEAADDVRAVVPLCPPCHRMYDDGDLDLSPHLEPRWRDSLGWAVEAVGLFVALRRITGKRWKPIEEAL